MASRPTDPVDADAPQRKNRVRARKTTKIRTGGGAAIGGSVKTRGGHFIGRDFIQIIRNEVHRGEDPAEAESVIAHYLDTLARDLAGLKLGTIDTSAAQAHKDVLELADVYVALNTQLDIPDDGTLEQWLARDKFRFLNEWVDVRRETRRVSAGEALAAHRELTLLGKPGSGKSTFGASVLLALAQAWQGRKELAELGETWVHGALLPIRVLLRRFADWLPPGEEPARAGDLWEFIGWDLRKSGYGLSSKVIEYVERIARSHGALLLLDGLDECGDRGNRVLAAVDEIKHTAGDKCRFLLTARPYAWPSGPDAASGVYSLADFDDAQVERFIRAWYAALVKRNWLAPVTLTTNSKTCSWRGIERIWSL
jgi:hypothetical protein